MRGRQWRPTFPAAGTCRRLRDALTGPDEAGWQDLAALIRQVLLEQAARQGSGYR